VLHPPRPCVGPMRVGPGAGWGRGARSGGVRERRVPQISPTGVSVPQAPIPPGFVPLPINWSQITMLYLWVLVLVVLWCRSDGRAIFFVRCSHVCRERAAYSSLGDYSFKNRIRMTSLT